MWELTEMKRLSKPMSYYFKAPLDLADSDVFLVDPMLATGNSAADAAAKLKAEGARRLRLITLLGCITGAEHFKTTASGSVQSFSLLSTKNSMNAPTLSRDSATPATDIAKREASLG